MLDDFEFYSESDQILNLYKNLDKTIVSNDDLFLIKTAELVYPDGRPIPRYRKPSPTSLPNYPRMPYRNMGQASYIEAFLTNGVLDTKKVQNFINNSAKTDADSIYKLYLQNEKNPNYQKLSEKFDTAYKELDNFVNDKRLNQNTRKLIQNAQSQLIGQKQIVLNKYIVANPGLFNPEAVRQSVKFLDKSGMTPKAPVPVGKVPNAPNAAAAMEAAVDAQQQFVKYTRTSPGKKMIEAIGAWISKNSSSIITRINSFPRPVQLVLKKIPYAFLALQGARILNSLVRGQEVPAAEFASFAAAIMSIPQVAAFAGPLAPALIIAGNVANLGGIDLANFAGDPAAGFSLWGFQITKQSKGRTEQQRDYINEDLSSFDKEVQNAYKHAQELRKINPKWNLIQLRSYIAGTYPWANNPNDYKFGQLNALLSRLKKQVPQVSQSPQQLQSETQSPQQADNIKTHRELLYKAYVDITGQTNMNLESASYNIEFIKQKIKALAPQYPNIDYKKALQALDNFINNNIPMWEQKHGKKFERMYLDPKAPTLKPGFQPA